MLGDTRGLDDLRPRERLFWLRLAREDTDARGDKWADASGTDE